MTALNRSLTAASAALARLAVAAPAATLPRSAPAVSSPIPVIFDCDIGGDIDDTWALIMLLKSPGLDVRLITTDQGDTVYRAKIVARLHARRACE